MTTWLATGCIVVACSRTPDTGATGESTVDSAIADVTIDARASSDANGDSLDLQELGVDGSVGDVSADGRSADAMDAVSDAGSSDASDVSDTSMSADGDAAADTKSTETTPDAADTKAETSESCPDPDYPPRTDGCPCMPQDPKFCHAANAGKVCIYSPYCPGPAGGTMYICELKTPFEVEPYWDWRLVCRTDCKTGKCPPTDGGTKD